MAKLAVLTEIIEPVVKSMGLDLVRIKMIGNDEERSLQIMAENSKTRQLHIDDCVKLSHALSDVLDEADPIEEAYRLEVSSPGIDRPLTRAKDYADWSGFDARILLIEPVMGRKTLKGEILSIEGDTVYIEDRKVSTQQFKLANVHNAKLLLTDELIAATVPLSAEGADELETEIDTPDDDASGEGQEN